LVRSRIAADPFWLLKVGKMLVALLASLQVLAAPDFCSDHAKASLQEQRLRRIGVLRVTLILPDADHGTYAIIKCCMAPNRRA